MKIVFDLGHPAHVHYFRNIIQYLKSKNHQVIVFARDKEVTHQLLEAYKIPYTSRGAGNTSALGKFLYMLKMDWFFFRKLRKEKVDLFVGFASPYAAQTAWLLGCKSITIDDTDQAHISHQFYKHFTTQILTPAVFDKDLGVKHERFNSFMELSYLHPKYFTPDKDIYQILGIEANTPYALIRFVSWQANHDWGHGGMSPEIKQTLVDLLSKKYRVFISAEGSLSEEFQKYKLKIPVHKMHDVLAGASLYVGEGATMASECAMLGIPAVYVNSLSSGTLRKQAEYGLLYEFGNTNGLVDFVTELIANEGLSELHTKRKETFLSEHIDPNKFLIEYIEKKVV